MKRCTPIRIGDVWTEFKQSNPQVAYKLAVGSVPQVWQELLGNGITAMTSDIRLERDTLYISVTSSVVRQEILMRRSAIRTAMNRKLGIEIIKNIVVR